MDSVILDTIDERGVATLTLNRPEAHNALNTQMIEILHQRFEVLSNSNDVRIIKFTANGKTFSSGGDLKWMLEMGKAPIDQNVLEAKKLAKLLHLIFKSKKPTLALTQGAVIGGGMGLICACDIVVAADNTFFSLPETKLGLIPAVISPYVIRTMGASAANRYMLTGESFSVIEAKQMGFVHESVLVEELDAMGEHFITRLLKNGPQALALTKELIHHVESSVIDEALLDKIANYLANCRATKEAQEGINAFLNKSDAPWIGK